MPCSGALCCRRAGLTRRAGASTSANSRRKSRIMRYFLFLVPQQIKRADHGTRRHRNLSTYKNYKRYATFEDASRAAKPDKYVVSVTFTQYIITGNPNALCSRQGETGISFRIERRPQCKEPVLPSPDVPGLQLVGPFPKYHSRRSLRHPFGRPVQGGRIESDKSRH
jgi:hypothetical protein